MRYVDTAIYDGPSVLLPRKGTLSNVFYVDGPFWNADTIFYTNINKSQILPRYFYYVMVNAHVEQYGTEGARPSLTQSVLNKVTIPVPPIEVQREVVRILDSFQALDDKLTAELEMREKQQKTIIGYEISVLGEVEMLTIGDVCTVRTGRKPTEILEYGEYAYINAGADTESGRVFSKNEEPYCITMPSRGVGGAGVVSFQRDGFWCGPLCYAIRSKRESVNTEFVFWYLSAVQDDLLKLRNTGGMSAVNKKDVMKFPILVPSTTTQNEIVNKLDTMQALIDSIRRERDLRRKQFAYYRDLILDFPRKGEPA